MLCENGTRVPAGWASGAAALLNVGGARMVCARRLQRQHMSLWSFDRNAIETRTELGDRPLRTHGVLASQRLFERRSVHGQNQAACFSG